MYSNEPKMKKLTFTIIAGVTLILIVVLLFVLGNKKEHSGRREVLSDVPVTIDTVKKQSLSHLVSLVGLIDPENDVEIISEAKGIVTRLKFKIGDQVKKGTVLVEVTTDVYPGHRFMGRVNNIASKADEAHTYPVEIQLPNDPDSPLKGGMFGRINFTSITSRNAIAISRDALIDAGKMRIRPIFMTTFAMVFGMLPIATASGAGAEWKNGIEFLEQ